MKRVEIGELWDRAAGLFEGEEPIAVERHGDIVGFYVPVRHEKGWEDVEPGDTLVRLEGSVRRVLEDTGMTEDELADYFDPSRPAPELPAARDKTTKPDRTPPDPTA